jgi:NAD(P)-dependent dehydrogenase (short-subunit alcohol dehydrogenase family)
MSDRPVAIVTGASRGIGRGVANALGAEGWAVVINYARNADAAKDAAAEVEAGGGKALVVQADVSSAEDRERLTDETLQQTGRIDLLVNNAGVAPTQRLDLLEATEESFDRVLGINLKGPYFLTQRVAREMIRLKEEGVVEAPRIVNIGSISAYAASPARGEYCLSKAAMGMMTDLFAVRLAENGINVYEVRPGITATDMTGAVKEKYDKLIAEGITPIRRWGQPEDIGKAVVAVARGLLPFSTGEVINVDGGFHLKSL